MKVFDQMLKGHDLSATSTLQLIILSVESFFVNTIFVFQFLHMLLTNYSVFELTPSFIWILLKDCLANPKTNPLITIVGFIICGLFCLNICFSLLVLMFFPTLFLIVWWGVVWICVFFLQKGVSLLSTKFGPMV
jgi:hypothetical protein